MNTRHSRSPWDIEYPLESEMDQLPLIMSPSGIVAEIMGPLSDEDGPHRGHYDCLLIAAAPDLLEACQDALGHLVLAGEDPLKGRAACADNLRKAIAKATGGGS